MFLKGLDKVMDELGYFVDKERVQQFRVKLLQMMEAEGFMRAIIFKHGFMITIYGLKTFDTAKKQLEVEYLDSFNTGIAPNLKMSFNYGVSAFCMKLDSDAKCKIDNAPCEYARTSEWPKCEHIYKSIKGE